MRRAGRHVSAWTLALTVSLSVVVARVLGDPEPSTSEAAPEKVTTVYKTRTVTVPVPDRAVRSSFVVATASTRAKCKTRKQKRSKRCRKKTAPRVEAVDGDPIATRYGPVQVRLKMKGSRIVDAQAIEFPNDIERTKQISADCLPKLRQQVLSAQSAKIDGVAGATYTTDGYRKSVQSALDIA
jgi:uncharacterized protein with FMN-binding domain